jgi:hypothetical protein
VLELLGYNAKSCTAQSYRHSRSRRWPPPAYARKVGYARVFGKDLLPRGITQIHNSVGMYLVAMEMVIALFLYAAALDYFALHDIDSHFFLTLFYGLYI